MRKLLFSLLLATTVASPALAQRPDHHDSSQSRDDSRSDHNQAHQDRSADRSQARDNRAEARANVQDRGRADMRSNPVGEPANVRQQLGVRGGAQANVNERGRPTLGDRDRSNGSVAQWQGRQREQIQAQQIAAQQVQGQRRDAARQQYDRRDNSRQGYDQQGRHRDDNQRQYDRQGRHRDDNQRQYDQRHSSHWDSNWRQDRRYDWRDYRNRHRSTFHLGLYYDPFGWGYQRYNVGFNLRPNYYSSNYWLNDPSMYALPYAPFPFRWVRYYNDAILVNTYTGQVADVIYDFFW
jgi:hypothetical protein